VLQGGAVHAVQQLGGRDGGDPDFFVRSQLLFEAPAQNVRFCTVSSERDDGGEQAGCGGAAGQGAAEFDGVQGQVFGGGAGGVAGVAAAGGAGEGDLGGAEAGPVADLHGR
jgi:hypothetical protein